VVAIAEKAFKTGLTRLIFLSVHAPNKSVLYVPVRRLFENHLKPVLFIDFYDPFDKEAEALFAGEYEDAKEASLVLAALDILGKGDLYQESDMRYEEKAPPMPESMLKLWKIGATGYFMQDIRQHACPSVHISLGKGMEFIEKQIAYAASILDNLDAYEAAIKSQSNAGWWR
jgi:hypothetical protein